MTIDEFFIRILIAFFSGFFIGLERQIHHKSAGIRTNALVCLGAAIFVLISFEFQDNAKVDITRVVGQVVTGVGFLGAGVILHQGISVHGLTTAATLWCSAAIGCMAATGLVMETIFASLLVILINTVFRKLDEIIKERF